VRIYRLLIGVDLKRVGWRRGKRMVEKRVKENKYGMMESMMILTSVVRK
jgi:hypothetical protein